MLKLLKTLVDWRRFIITSGLIAALVMAGASLLLPKWYTASTSIFPPETNAPTAMYTELLQSLTLPLVGGLGGGVAPETIYIEMLKSRSISQRLIEEFNYKEIYEQSVIELALKEFGRHSGYTLLENGLLVITFEDRDPERAAAVTNRKVELLDEFNRSLNVTSATRTREFVESQLVARRAELEEAERALQSFQESKQTLQIDQQLAAALDIVSDLTGKAIALETSLDIMSHYSSRTSEEYIRKRLEYDEVVAQLRKLKVSSGDSEADMVRSFIPALEDVPGLALEFMRRRREVEVQSTVYTMLLKEFEKSRIEEARDTPTVQVLDPASVPNLRSRPRRKILVLAGGIVGLGWGAFIALFVVAWREETDDHAGFKAVLGPVANDLARFFRRN